MSVPFPSVQFFAALRDAMGAEQERFRRLGFFDTTMGVRVLRDGRPPAEFALTFEVFDCTRVHEGFADVQPDFVLEGPLPVWRDMLDAIHHLGAADTAHSINTLTHFGDHLKVVYDDPNGHDMLYRFAESIQEFFDLAARVDFTYDDGRRPPARSAA
ncbi:MAG: hypothetical protein U0807_04745 [Candidatus Binatia bacterium]